MQTNANKRAQTQTNADFRLSEKGSKIKHRQDTILFKIITRMKLLSSNHLGDCSYSFQGSSEIICITVTVCLFFLQNAVTGNKSLQEFSRISGSYSYMT